MFDQNLKNTAADWICPGGPVNAATGLLPPVFQSFSISSCT
jgi:hypothetical protein